MATSLCEMHKKIGSLKGKIIENGVLKLLGPKNSIELFLQQVEATRRTFTRENYETYGETPLLDLVVKTINSEQVYLIGEWMLFEPFLKKFGVEIEYPTEDTLLAERMVLLAVKP